MKRCSKCGAIKPLNEFYRRGTGYQSYCKPCNHKSVAAVHQRNGRPLRFLEPYHLTPERFSAILEAQDGKCASCGVELVIAGPRGSSKFAIDHDHRCCSGQRSCGECVRGILCTGCNVALGLIGDDPDRALALASYLLRFEDVLQGVGV